MIVRKTYKLQRRQVASLHVTVKFPLPFLESPVVSEPLVKAAKVNIGNAMQSGSHRKRHALCPRRRIMQQRQRIGLVIAAEIKKEAIIAHRQLSALRRI